MQQTTYDVVLFGIVFAEQPGQPANDGLRRDEFGNPPRLVAESAGSSIDPDVQARRATEGELSAGFQSDLTMDEDAVHGLLAAEESATESDQDLDFGTLYAKYRRLAAEQAALRRCVAADTAGLWRFETNGEKTIVAAAADPAALAKLPAGTLTPVDATTARRWCDAAAGPHRSTATTTSPS